ncbi:putative ssRNA binding protein [Endozoicomonas montiporae CL-33]|uniref:Putative ssRNA binding protein n=1 Tax=Endozoicomonas montiporae CL-33 TaxID=570277 RepID=A0A142BDR4_9GAMM|nr:putative ssRNA binding protein [Endozoicomonas montiporae CL-33]
MTMSKSLWVTGQYPEGHKGRTTSNSELLAPFGYCEEFQRSSRDSEWLRNSCLEGGIAITCRLNTKNTEVRLNPAWLIRPLLYIKHSASYELDFLPCINIYEK